MSNPCILKNYPSLSKKYDTLVKAGLNAKEAAMKVALDEHKKLHEQVNNFRASINPEFKPVPYVSHPYLAKVGEINAKHNTNISEINKNNKVKIEKAKMAEKFGSRVTKNVAPTKDNGISIGDTNSIENIKSKLIPLQLSVVERAEKAIKTLKSVLPNFDIILHTDEGSYNAAVEKVKGEQNTKGNFHYIKDNDGSLSGRIDINLNRANKLTVAHEVAHGIMLKVFGENSEIYEKFVDNIQKILNTTTDDYLVDFANNYKGDVKYEEYIIELTAILNQEYTKISPTILQKIAAVINETVSKITFGKITVFEDTKNTKELIDFLNTVSKSIRQGEEIGNINNFGATGTINTSGSKSQMPMSAGNILYADSKILPKPSKKIKNSAVAIKFQESAANFWGGSIVTSETITPEQEKLITENGIQEAIDALEQDEVGNAANWYSTAIQTAIAVAGIIHTELVSKASAMKYEVFAKEKDPEGAARMALRMALAITSQNLNVDVNTQYAEEQFDYFKKNGRFDASKLYGAKAPAISSNLKLANTIIEKMGLNAAEEFISKGFTVTGLEVAFKEATGKKVKISGLRNDDVNGAAIFGPKIGQGFLQNLMGKFDPVTIDLWMRRTWGRWTGDVIGDGITENRMARLYTTVMQAIKNKELNITLPKEFKKHKPVQVKNEKGKLTLTMDDKFSFDRENNMEFVASLNAVADEIRLIADNHYKNIHYLPMTKDMYDKFLSGDISYVQASNKLKSLNERQKEKYKVYVAAQKAKGLKALALNDKKIKDGETILGWLSTQNKKEGKIYIPTNEEISKRKPKWGNAAKNIISDLNPTDIPSNQDRRVITRIVNNIRKGLTERGYEVTNADVQAILWYPEKDIWAKMRGEEESNLKLSYDNQFIKIATERGLGEQAEAVAKDIRGRGTERTSTTPNGRPNESVRGVANAPTTKENNSQVESQPVSKSQKEVNDLTNTVSNSRTSTEITNAIKNASENIIDKNILAINAGLAVHGGETKINKIDLSKVNGGVRAIYGPGLYFSDGLTKATDYGKEFTYINPSELSILDTKKPITKNFIESIKEISKKSEQDGKHMLSAISEYYAEELSKEVSKNNSIDDARKNLRDKTKNETVFDSNWTQILKELGYDTVKNGYEYVVFDAEKGSNALVSNVDSHIHNEYDNALKDNSNPALVTLIEQNVVNVISKSQKKLKDEVSSIIEDARAQGMSEDTIRSFFEDNGYDMGVVDTAMGTETKVPIRTELSDKFLPGYSEMLSKLNKIIDETSKKIDSTKKRVHTSALAYLQSSLVYENATDVQREALVRMLNKKLGVREKSAPSPGKLFDTIKDIKNITMTDTQLLKQRIRDMEKSSRDTKGAWLKISAEVIKSVRALKINGKISTSQLTAILNKFSKINMFNDDSINTFLDYMSNVFKDVDYQNKLTAANKIKKQIAKLAANKSKNADLRALAKKFLELDTSLVEDIDRYNSIATQLKESLTGTKATESFVDIIDINDAFNYINSALSVQNRILLDRKADELENTYGISANGLTYSEIVKLIKENKIVTPKDEQYARDQSQELFDSYSERINEILETGIDSVTGENIEFTASQEQTIKKFMSMDLSLLDLKTVLEAVDSLQNFIQNKSIAKMDAIYATYLGTVNPKELIIDSKIAKKIKLYWNSLAGEVMYNQFASLPALLEKMFKGVMSGGNFQDMMGLTSLISQKASAVNEVNIFSKEYIKQFGGKKPNKKDFFDEENIVERGMYAHMLRTIIGTSEQMKDDFIRSKNDIIGSIENLLKDGNSDKEIKLGELYQKVYNKILKDANNISEVNNKTHIINKNAVDFWVEKWESKFDEMSDVSKSVYNEILEREYNYTPARYTNIDSKKTGDIDLTKSVFNSNNGTLFKEESGSLKKAQHLPLPVGSYINMSFDTKNINSMYDALVDIKTAAPIRQIQAFINSKEIKKLIPSRDDRKILFDRIDNYIKLTRNKGFSNNEQISELLKKFNTLTSIGVASALASLSQPFKQVVPLLGNTIINANGINIANLWDSSVREFIDNSGETVANRSMASQFQIIKANKIKDLISKSGDIKGLVYTRKLGEFYLKTFLENPDVFIARASWFTYYKDYLSKNKIKFDINVYNKDAKNYATRMVDRQQNISDPELGGKMFTTNDGLNSFIGKTAFAFANFRVNQTIRLMNDITTLTSRTSSTQDKTIAAKSLAGFAVEVAIFRLISIATTVAISSAARALWDEEEETEEERIKRMNNIYKGQLSNSVADIFSPVPPTDAAVTTAVNWVLNKSQEELPEEEKILLFDMQNQDTYKSLGLYGIAASNFSKSIEMLNMYNNQKFTDKYGNIKNVSDEDADKMPSIIALDILSTARLLPADVGNIAKSEIKIIQKRSKTEKQSTPSTSKKSDYKSPELKAEEKQMENENRPENAEIKAEMRAINAEIKAEQNE